MTTNPALTLYDAWNGMYQTMGLHSWQRKSVAENLHVVDPSTDNYLQDVPYKSDRYLSPQMVNHRTGFGPSARFVDGRLIYTLGYLGNGSVQAPLFQLAPDGYFRLGSIFNPHTYVTRGAFERVQYHTFLGANRTYDHQYRQWAWWCKGFDSDHPWLRTRDWQQHTYYWHHRMMPASTWLRLVSVGGAWRVTVADHQDDADNLSSKLDSQYRNAEAHYAKWRRRYFLEHGLPDPEKHLDASDIETVNYLVQHLHTYDPPKARMPGLSS